MDETIRALIRRSQQGDNAAFAELYDLHAKKVHAFAYHKVFDRDLAEDITSETFIKAFRKLGSFKDADDASFSGWLCAIARNAVADHFRKERPRLSLDDAFDLPDDDPIAERVQMAIDSGKVRALMRSLSAEQREVVALRVWEEMSYAEIAAATGRSEAACKMSFSRSLAKLKAAAALAFLIAFIPFSL